jgi:4-amino-4-deoxy-L-arabinose transferase-like glycosyltransferase
MGCKGLIGHHVARTGDMDSLLVLFSLLTIYNFCCYIDFSQRKRIILSGLFLGLAFFTKATASFLILPGLFVYVIYRQQLKRLFTDYFFWIGAGVFICFVILCYILFHFISLPIHDPVYNVTTVWERMFLTDAWLRYTHTGLGGIGAEGIEPLWLIKTLDAKFNLWNYLFYLAIILFVYRSFFKKKVAANEGLHRLSKLSLCIITASCFILFFSKTKLVWYLAPVLPFFSVFTFIELQRYFIKYKTAVIIFSCLIVFTITRSFVFISTVKNDFNTELKKQRQVLQNESIVFYKADRNEQDIMLYLKWFGIKYKFEYEIEKLPTGLVIGKTENLNLVLNRFQTRKIIINKNGNFLINSN